jgi:hypothetical protein
MTLLSTIGSESICMFEPPMRDAFAQHIGVYVGDSGKYVASAHDDVVFLWLVGTFEMKLHARVQAHISTIRTVRFFPVANIMLQHGTGLGHGLCVTLRY